MDYIAITREEFREKITRNPRGYGFVRARRERPELKEGREIQALIEEVELMATLKEIEMGLFGPKK